MGFHTFDPDETDRLEDPSRFRFCSREELLQYLPREDAAVVLDVGSGTGFYTDELAPFLGSVIGYDVQPAMHDQYRDRGIPDNVSPVTGDASSLPFADWSFHGAVSTMTFHESASDESMRELKRVLASEAPLVIVDWSSNGNGESGPSLSERYTVMEAQDLLSEAGFTIQSAAERSETFHIVAQS